MQISIYSLPEAKPLECGSGAAALPFIPIYWG
jgi:hypothetical protein